MNTMMKDMPATNELKNIEAAFAKVMMPHHQAGINMAKVILKYRNGHAVKRMAENIISSQLVEIQQINITLNKEYEKVYCSNRHRCNNTTTGASSLAGVLTGHLLPGLILS